jgi:hypothetical protein
VRVVRQGLRAFAVAVALAAITVVAGGAPGRHQEHRTAPQTWAVGTTAEPIPDMPLEGGGGGGNGLRA